VNIRNLAVVAALGLATMAGACTSAAPVQPLPAQTVQPTQSATASPSPAPAIEPQPVRVTTSPTTRPATAPACRGAVIHRLDASDTGPPWKPLCLGVGGVLLVTNLGPEGFSASPRDKVECNYEAAVRECRLLRTGTVKFTIVNASQTRTLTVRIVKSSPQAPAPACLGAGKTFVIDATDDGPQRWPVCMRTSATVRVVNLGPEGFQVSPAGAVKCYYEGGVRVCRFTGPGTVTFTTTHGDSAPRIQKVVAIR
jgi:hypothetical protein